MEGNPSVDCREGEEGSSVLVNETLKLVIHDDLIVVSSDGG